MRDVNTSTTPTSAFKLEVKALVDAYIREANASLQAGQPDEVRGFVNPVAIAMRHFLPLGARSAFAKDDAFAEEFEWRLAIQLNQNTVPLDLKFRPGISMPTPYLEIPLSSDQETIEVAEIIIGPCPHWSQAVDSVKMILRKENIKGVKVRYCDIPYRNW